MELRSYTRGDIVGKRVILRADLDVNPEEVDILRLERLAPNIKELLGFGAKQIVIIGHRGRPEGRFEEAFSLAPVKGRLEQLLNKTGVQQKINFVTVDSVNKPDDVLVMLENLRFYPGEKKGDLDFARELSRWGDIYVNDAFGNSHRRDASMLALPQALGKSFVGPGLVNEIKHLILFTEHTPHPFVAVLGGVKIETKLPLIKFLLKQADVIVVGGVLANTILAGQGINVGQSLVEKDYLGVASELKSAKLILPVDAKSRGGRVLALSEIGGDDFIGDIGPQTIALFKDKLAGAAAIIWNGPLGKFEDPLFQDGTREVVAAIVASGAKTVTGGGDTLDVLAQLHMQDKFGFVSVGGGAMLTFLAGEPMPALEVLKISN